MTSVLIAAAQPAHRLDETLKAVHAFYEEAWDNLVQILGIGGLIAGALFTGAVIIAQILISRWQRQSFRDERETLERRIDEGVARARAEAQQTFLPTIQQLAQRVEGVHADMLRTSANTLHSFGGFSVDAGRRVTGASFVWLAAQYRFLLGQGDQAVAETLDVVRRILDAVPERDAVAELRDNSEPLDAFRTLAYFFQQQQQEQKVGPRTAAVLPQLV